MKDEGERYYQRYHGELHLTDRMMINCEDTPRREIDNEIEWVMQHSNRRPTNIRRSLHRSPASGGNRHIVRELEF